MTNMNPETRYRMFENRREQNAVLACLLAVTAFALGCSGEPAVERTFDAYDDFLQEQWECHRDHHFDPISEEQYWSMDWNLAPGTPWRECMEIYGHKKKYEDDEYFECLTEFLQDGIIMSLGGCGGMIGDLDDGACFGRGEVRPEIVECQVEMQEG